ncbi:ribose-5-phosphate isomerase, partial [Streptococcus agalactiae]|nr:ribose-5-phosphate isomerase [Streptococcus agalactiae]MCC9752940.1 ribose-5-phosphate isomerase [Streptococcus agalactiae]MCC9859906.1 ribose-5-phosphate isomerase [Streptococcus agalactiae]MCC9860819.1 ribose-5-phosphate isomerase [Streptococcus agalactiae]MCC9874288.1 ribose-5-phosphate isomerase [Streptococcus agalactiae]
SIIIQEQMKSLHTAKLIEISYPTTA